MQITDRIKDVIKTGGEWVSSLEIEDIISQHEAVSEVAVIGVKDEKWGERPLAIVVRDPKASAHATEDEIKTHAKIYADSGMISKFGIPAQNSVCGSAPQNECRKDRQEGAAAEVRRCRLNGRRRDGQQLGSALKRQEAGSGRF